MSRRVTTEAGGEFIPALLDVLLLPGETLVPPRTWDEAREALEAADRGARRLVAVPGAGPRRGDIATLVEFVQVAHRNGHLVGAQLLGLRRVRIALMRHTGPFLEAVVTAVTEPASLDPAGVERLKAVIAACPGAREELDLSATPAELIDRLALRQFALRMSLRPGMKLALLRSPTLAERVFLLERLVMGGGDPSQGEVGQGTELDEDVDGPDGELPEVVPQAIAREEERMTGDPGESSRSQLIIRCLRELRWKDPAPPQISPSEARELLHEARRLLDEAHGGAHEEVKLKILDRVGDWAWELVHNLPPGTVQGRTGMLFWGPPGTGKSTLANAVAAATHRRLECIPMGATDATGLAGSDRAYLGSGPGLVARRLLASTPRPASQVCLLFDELDKMARDSARDPLPVLLALFDPSQEGFLEAFLPIPIPIPGMLIATANSLEPLPAPLLDRLELIRVPAYTREEQVAIGRGHLLPRLMKGKGVTARVIRLDPEVVESLVFDFPASEGMRALEHRLATVLQPARRRHLETGRSIRVTVALARAWVGEPAAERQIGFHVGGIPPSTASRLTVSPPSASTVRSPRACGCPQPGRGRPSPGVRPVSRSLRKKAAWARRCDQIAQEEVRP